MVNKDFIRNNIMGPNPMKMIEELLAHHLIPADSLVMDLGCGKGVTSVFLAKEYGLRVFAVDLWISPSENWERFKKMGLDSKQVVPIYAEAHNLPFAEKFFDSVVCIDAYHYFGADPDFLDKHLLPFVKEGGFLLIAIPGIKEDFDDNIPEEMLFSWTEEEIEMLRSTAYWTGIFESSKGAEIVSKFELEGFDECWNDWLVCDNEYAVSDRASMEAGAGKYMNLLGFILKKS